MNYDSLLAATDELALELKEDPLFIELKTLKKQIDSLYKIEINEFHKWETKYNEAKQYGSYYPGLKDIQSNFVNAKACLFSKEEVQKYFKIQKEFQDMLDTITNKIVSSVSDKKENENDTKKMHNCVF